MSEIRYVLMDPSKNITILVETPLTIDKHSEVAKVLMKLEPTAEQLGFIMSFDEKDIFIRMAGGEFCGNAAMSVASLYAMEHKLDRYETQVSFYGNELSIKNEVKVIVNKLTDENYEGLVYMPKPKRIENVDIDNIKALPIVSFEGISHIIIDKEIEKNLAEKYIKDWCKLLNLEALGFMFYKKIDDSNYELKPLVYVRDIDSLFWENACASGTFAFGTYQMLHNNLSQIFVKQAGGDVLEVKNENGDFCLIGQAKFLYKKTFKGVFE